MSSITSQNVLRLPKNVSDEMSMGNRGYHMDGTIVLGVFDDEVWEQCVYWHEVGHLECGDDEREAWLYALTKLPKDLPFKYKREMIKCIRSYL